MDEEEGWAQRKERREERSNEESEKMKKVVKKMNNEKVASLTPAILYHQLHNSLLSFFSRQ